MDKNFKISKNTKIISSAIVGIIILAIISISFYRYENNKFYTSVNSNIATLNANIASFKTGISQNAEYLNPTFTKTYETSFTNTTAQLQDNAKNFFNTENSKNILNREITKAEYYNYMTQFTQEVASYKSTFEPLVTIMNKGGKLTTEQVTAIQGALKTLSNSSALTNAMNVYNQPNTYMNMVVKSPYTIKQNLINLSDNLSTLNFKPVNKDVTSILTTNLI